MISDGPRTEIDSAVEAAAEPEWFTEGQTRHLVAPPGWTELVSEDIEDEQPAPNRMKGTTIVDNAPSFITAVNTQAPRKAYDPIVYSQPDTLRVTAVLNHHQVHDAKDPAVSVSGENETQVPGWGDHRVQLQFRRSDEWKLWLKLDGTLQEQDAFAKFIEDRIDDIVSDDPRFPQGPTPSQADMLEVSRTFQATVSARFERRTTLQSGKINLTYNEEIVAQAGGGAAGTVEIPEQFSIAVRPFYGSDKVFVRARLRYRVEREKLTLGYHLIRPDLIEEAIYDEEISKVEQGLSVVVLEGQAP